LIGLRRGIWAAGVPARALLIGAIRLYRATLSGVLGGQCRFHPTCSVYAEAAIRSRGATVGSVLAAWRILRCNPFGRGGIEHAPAAAAHRSSQRSDEEYDEVTLLSHERTV